MSSRVGTVWLVLLALFTFDVLAKSDFEISEPRLDLINGQYYMDTHIDYQMSEKALEALENGVPLTVKIELQIRKLWRLYWEENTLETELRYRIQYHALTGLYQVSDLQQDEHDHFVTRDAALRELGNLHKIKLIKSSEMEPDQEYLLRLRADLDIESLPLPLRPLAYLHRGWKLTSGWCQWPLNP